MIKKVGVLVLVIGILYGSVAYADEFYEYPEYENSKITVYTHKSDFDVYEYSEIYFSVWDEPDNIINVKEYVIQDGMVTCYLSSVIPTKKYVFHAKDIYYDGSYKSSFEMPIIMALADSDFKVRILKTSVLNSKIFDVYFSNQMDIERLAKENMKLFVGDQQLVGGQKGGLEIVDSIDGFRGVFRITDDFEFKSGIEYRLEIEKGVQTKDGAKVQLNPLIAYLYKSEEENDNTSVLGAECFRINNKTIACVFKNEMAVVDFLNIKDGFGRELSIEEHTWRMDENLECKILVLEFLDDIEQLKTIYIDGIKSRFSEQVFSFASHVQTLNEEIDIVDVQIQDPSNIKIEVNQPLTNNDIEDLHVYVKGSDAIATVAIDEDDPFVIHIELTLQKAIYANTQQNVTLKGQYKDAFGIDHDINLNFPFRFSYVPNFNPRIVKAYFRDEWNIIAKSSHPLLEVPDFEHIEILQPLVNNDYILPIENIYLEDPFTIRIELMRSSTMKDVVLKITGMNDASGNLSIEGKFNVDGPWN